MRRELINLFGEAGAVTAAAERGTNRAGCLCDVLLIHPPTLGRPPARPPGSAQPWVRNLRSRHKSSQRVEWGGILCCVHITPRARELCSHHSHSARLHYYCCCLACDNCHCESEWAPLCRVCICARSLARSPARIAMSRSSGGLCAGEFAPRQPIVREFSGNSQRLQRASWNIFSVFCI